ncbi:MAG: hypothetical protein QW524_03850 [Candidatus Woesearchaeota archaeon]
MAVLLALITTGEGSWRHLFLLLNSYDWDKVYVLTNKYGFEKLKFKEEKVKKIEINFNAPYDYIIEEIKNKLRDLNLVEVAVNISSGTGKEHMALLVALIQLGIAINFVDLEEGSLKIIGT